MPITHASRTPVRLSGGATRASAENEPDETAAKVRINLIAMLLVSTLIAQGNSGGADRRHSATCACEWLVPQNTH